MELENLVRQRPATAFPGAGWHLDTHPFQGLVKRGVFEGESGIGDGNVRKEVARGRSHRDVLFLKEPGRFFSALRPPHGGRKEAVVLIVVKR